MKRESFEDEEVAKLMNETFVSIKVDKEERPDIDSVYMDIARSMSGRGGWPLTILMTPEKMPFYAATYIPKSGKRGMTGLMELIPKIRKLWENDRERLVEKGKTVVESLKKDELGMEKELDSSILDDAFDHLSMTFDDEYGGFGNDQKFPSPQNFLFLLRYSEKEEKADEIVHKTLREMRKGGIYDHLGYGFHRYSTDRRWKLPHFEKMLYDQAMILMAYTEAWLSNPDSLYSKTVEEVVAYVDRNLRSESGGFFSSEDAESSGKEGAYYTWRKEEIEDLLGKESDLFVDLFNVEDKGNFREEASNEKTGENVLLLEKTIEDFAVEKDISAEKLRDKVERMKNKLLDERLKREKPDVDNKILTDWNSLMVAALSRAGFVFDEERYIDMAEETLSFILDEMVKNGELHHASIESEVSVKGGLDDHSFLIWALLRLYQSAFKPEYLKRAIDLTDTMMEYFWDEEKGGFFISRTDDDELPVNKKDVRDGAYPSGNSIALFDLVKLNQITGDEKYSEAVEKMIESFSGKISQNPAQFTMSMTALQSWWAGGKEVMIVGNEDEEMLDVLREQFSPNTVVIVKDEENSDELDKLLGFTSSMTKVDGKTTAYICEDFTCREPVTDIDEFESRLVEKD
ncbi:MAG: thioredoxin domain-containing protein [Candidatus Thermoplasmatota archaeon]|nr:thioredoxin domain-containing protein [Candidatus Thermoplasmatota archaeon]